MKKKTIIAIIICILVVLTIVLTGLTIYKKNLSKTRNKEFETAVTQYYNYHMSNIKGADQAEVTLSMINNVIKTKNEKYDIKSLKKCNDDSKALLTLSNGKVKKVEISLNCK